MKKSLIALATSATFAVPVFAQSSVTLYGVVDEGFNYTNNVGGKHDYELQSGYAQGSRWGLKGAEDLGGGTKAIFQLENGFNLNNGRLGQGGLLFGRQAYVGVSNATFGTVTLGRQYDSVVDYLAQTTANGNWAGYLFSHPFDNDNTDNSFRVNNTVKYASPDFAGLQFGGTYSFSNATGFANNRQFSLGAQYANGGLLVAAAYLNADNPGQSSGGAITSTDANFVAERLRIFGGGINYTFGPATVGFVYTNTNIKNPSANAGYLSSTETIQPVTGPLAGGKLNTLKYQNFELNGKYQITPAFFVGAQYVYTLENYDATTGSVKPKIHSVGLMADYNLSKRTDIYFQGAYQKVAGSQTGSSLDQAYVPGAADLSSNSKQLVVRAAIRHKF
ncbi:MULTISPECIES: porin [Paraburkholderia]|jgi:predicted porin|uniref:Porin n=1 Tax=Paraburkholderia fungorum TaxID=134537 RepID=A0AAW3VA02_9BURK|nr:MULTISPECIES: porin [Paraburkholderia]MBB4519786.1 putative porin [Paraburkholderia fungorum]MBB6207468.1 putative porin [Paraburkholderia fungorum]MDE1009406.1 porin [Paraburkholderia fungorum]PNE56742.1 porin [Paraburkholderia fungorum]PZR39549.1 MAG: porin [Paraburkholderia fungorum]